jgi:hypothetical protein
MKVVSEMRLLSVIPELRAVGGAEWLAFEDDECGRI